MSLLRYVQLWGVLDVVYILWKFFDALLNSQIPFYNSISESLHAAVAFGQTSLVILTIVSAVVTLSIVISGPLMLMGKNIGVYISLVQAPFRLFFVIPPTIFFIHAITKYIALPDILLVTIIIIIEIIKLVTEILWLKSQKQSIEP